MHCTIGIIGQDGRAKPAILKVVPLPALRAVRGTTSLNDSTNIRIPVVQVNVVGGTENKPIGTAVICDPIIDGVSINVDYAWDLIFTLDHNGCLALSANVAQSNGLDDALQNPQLKLVRFEGASLDIVVSSEDLRELITTLLAQAKVFVDDIRKKPVIIARFSGMTIWSDIR
jgi:hypothetical protein